MDLSHTGAPLQGFIYPILKPADIIQCLSEIGIEISRDELQNPGHHKEKLRKIFTALVRTVLCYRQ